MKRALLQFSLCCTAFFTPALLAQSFEPDEATKAYLNLWRKGEYQKALDRLEKEIRRSTDGVPIHWIQDRAQLMFDLGRVYESVSDLEWLHQQRPNPTSTLQLAELYLYLGRKKSAMRILREVQSRFRRATRYEDDTDNDIALHRIREILGENPRELFQSLLKIQPREKDVDKVKRFTAAGELAFRKFDYQLGATYFQKALELDEDHLDALLGLAECYWRSHDPRLEQVLDAVLAINPAAPRAVAIEVEMKLDANQPEEALVLIEKVLAINPMNLRHLGLQAGAYFLLDRQEDLQRTFATAETVNPAPSMVYSTAGRIASRHYRFQEGLGFQATALALDEDDHHARALYAYDLLRLGKDEQGRTQLNLAFEADRFNVQVYNMLELMDTLAKFTVVERGDFVLKMPAEEVPIWGGDALDLVARAAVQFEKKYKVELEEPVMLQIFDNHDDFMVRSIGLPGNVGHLGICFGRLITMSSPSARDKYGMNWRSVLWHEFIHVITLQKTNNRMARWLSEGISVYEETLEDPAWGQRLDPAYKMVVGEEGTPGIREIQQLFMQPKTTAHIMFGYFLSGELVRFYVDTHGFDALERALSAIGAGKGTEDALLEAAGMDEETFNGAFHAFMDDRFKPFQYLPDHRQLGLQEPAAGGEGGERLLISPFTDALQRGKSAIKAEDWAKAEEVLLKALDMFPEYLGPDSPLHMLMLVYDAQERQDDVIELLKRSIGLDATDFASARRLAEHYHGREAWTPLTEVTRKALDIDPFDVNMNRFRLEALARKDPAKALGVADRLIHLDAARAVDYRLKRIDLLLNQEKKVRAKREVLQLLEDVPYSWEAQKRLLELAGENER